MKCCAGKNFLLDYKNNHWENVEIVTLSASPSADDWRCSMNRNSFQAKPKSVSEPIRKKFFISFDANQLKIILHRSELIRVNPNSVLIETNPYSDWYIFIMIETSDWDGLIFNWFATNEVEIFFQIGSEWISIRNWLFYPSLTWILKESVWRQ